MAPKKRQRPVRVEINGDGIIDLLRQDLESGAEPVTSFGGSPPVPPVLDRVFAEVIREYVHREEEGGRATGGGRRITKSKVFAYGDVVRRVKSFYTRHLPSNSKSRDACLSLFRDRNIIGSGRYGVVYDAEVSADAEAGPGRPGQRYAVKAVQIYPFAHGMLYQNLVNEIEIGRKMGEAGVGPKVRAVHWCERDGGMLVMIVSDLMAGGDLARFSQMQAVTAEHVAQIEKKLRRMHRAGFLHNDVHSRNVLVDTDGKGGFEFYISDFGFSRPGKDPEKRKAEIQVVRSFASLVARDRMRGLLYNMIADGRVAATIRFAQSAPASSSVWLDGTTYSDAASSPESGSQPQ